MQNHFVRTACIAIILIVMSLSLGSFLADQEGQMVAFGVIAAIAGIVGLMVMGRQAWKLIIIAPFLCPFENTLGAYALAGVVGVWGLVLALFRHIQLKWTSFFALDALLLLFTCCLVRLYVQHPASLCVFGLDAQYIGGKENVIYLAFLVYYLAISSWRGSPDEVLSVVRRCAYIAVAAQIAWGLYATFKLLHSGVGFFDRRNTCFLGLGYLLVFYAYASVPLACMWRYPKNIFLFLLGIGIVLISGTREYLGHLGLACVFLCFLKKELMSALVCFAAVLCCITLMSETGMLRMLPGSMQRVVGLVPWAKIEMKWRRGSQGTIQTRLEIWRFALDPRTGVIKDYCWGDGFQTETAEFLRVGIGDLRLRSAGGELSAQRWSMSLAKSGSLHNMALTCVHRTGYVGLGLVALISLTYLLMLVRISQALRYSRDYPPMMMVLLPMVGIIAAIPWGTFTYTGLFKYFYSLGLIKTVYCALRDKGMIQPLLIRSHYVPLMLREAE
ncbi:MAG: hypothetical protein ACI4O9_00385 [Akkermansia sp.]